MSINAFGDEDTAGCVEVQGVEAHAALEATGAHGALLEESGREATFSQGREGADSVVSEDDGGLGEVNFEGCGLESQDAGKGFAAHLVTHVVRVGEGANDDLTLPVCPPTQDHAPPEERGVPCDEDYMGRAGLPGEEGSMQRAGVEGPERAATVGKLLKDAPDEDSRLDSPTMGGRRMEWS